VEWATGGKHREHCPAGVRCVIGVFGKELRGYAREREEDMQKGLSCIVALFSTMKCRTESRRLVIG
jgi:hypothetical protein